MDKACSKCDERKDLAAFGPNKWHADGRQSACRECAAAAAREPAARALQRAATRARGARQSTPERKQAQREYDARYRRTEGRRTSAARYHASEKGQASATRRRHARRAVGVPSVASVERIRNANRCHWCGRIFDRDNRPTIEHIVAITNGGSNDDANLVAACASCNRRKGARPVNPITQQGVLV